VHEKKKKKEASFDVVVRIIVISSELRRGYVQAVGHIGNAKPSCDKTPAMSEA
jgi:hypothetical protein